MATETQFGFKDLFTYLVGNAAKADRWLAIRPGTDMALGLALCQHILARNLHDRRFCVGWIIGFEQWRDFIFARGYTPEWAEPITGIAAAEIRRLAEEIAAADGCVIFASRGINQHTNGTQTNRVLMFLAAITGNWGRRGGAYFNMSAGTPIARHFGSRYPFGHGRSYTPFEFTDLALDATKADAGTGELRLRFTVRNTGSRAGVAVPQLYVRDLLASVVRPVKELKAFGRVELRAGESARVTFEVPTDMLCFTGKQGRRIVEPGELELQVGASSADIRLRALVVVTGAARTLGREWRMESRCLVER
jgi:hypothetical protein